MEEESAQVDAPALAATDVDAVLRSRGYPRLLVLAALIGVLVSLASWCYLEFVHVLQAWAYDGLPSALGFGAPPWWWPLPVLLVAGVLISVAIARLPGHGGHEPSQGLTAGPPTQPAELPGILLASVATIGLGLVLGPEAPLIALGTGLTLFMLRRSKREVPERASLVLTAAAGFAALATVFGSPLIGVIIIIEAAGLGGPTLPLVLLPGLTAAGIGSLVFVGVGSLTGLSSSDYAITLPALPSYPHPDAGDFAWTIVLSVAAAVVTLLIMQIARRVAGLVAWRPYIVVPSAALVVGALAIVFSELTGFPAGAVLFSGQEAMAPVVSQAGILSLATLGALVIFKGLAWGVSLGSARGGPTFPAIFLGLTAGVLAGHLPGFAQTPAVAVLIGACAVSVLRLPLASVILAVMLSGAGLGTTALIVVGVVAAYITVVRVSGGPAASTQVTRTGKTSGRQAPVAEDVGEPTERV